MSRPKEKQPVEKWEQYEAASDRGSRKKVRFYRDFDALCNRYVRDGLVASEAMQEFVPRCRKVMTQHYQLASLVSAATCYGLRKTPVDRPLKFLHPNTRPLAAKIGLGKSQTVSDLEELQTSFEFVLGRTDVDQRVAETVALFAFQAQGIGTLKPDRQMNLALSEVAGYYAQEWFRSFLADTIRISTDLKK